MIAGEQLLEVAARVQREQEDGDEAIAAWLAERQLDGDAVALFGQTMFGVVRELARETGLEKATVAVLVYALQVGIVVGEGGVGGD